MSERSEARAGDRWFDPYEERRAYRESVMRRVRLEERRYWRRELARFVLFWLVLASAVLVLPAAWWVATHATRLLACA